MDAKKCDRCGVLYTDICWVAGHVKFSDNEHEKAVVLKYGSSQLTTDLCPDCRASFKSWWDSINPESLYHEMKEKAENLKGVPNGN